MSNALEMLRGGDLNFTIIWPDENGPMDITDWVVTAFEPSKDIVDLLTLEITDALVGEITGQLSWDNSLKDGTKSFRVQLSRGEDDMSTPPIYVVLR